MDSSFTKISDENKQLKQWIADLQSNMYINCVYCGHRYGPGTYVPASEDEAHATIADILKEHIKQCSQHPMFALRVENIELNRLIRLYQLELKKQDSHENY